MPIGRDFSESIFTKLNNTKRHCIMCTFLYWSLEINVESMDRYHLRREIWLSQRRCPQNSPSALLWISVLTQGGGGGGTGTNFRGAGARLHCVFLSFSVVSLFATMPESLCNWQHSRFNVKIFSHVWWWGEAGGGDQKNFPQGPETALSGPWCVCVCVWVCVCVYPVSNVIPIGRNVLKTLASFHVQH
jgi:hypothetical protein